MVIKLKFTGVSVSTLKIILLIKLRIKFNFLKIQFKSDISFLDIK